MPPDNGTPAAFDHGPAGRIVLDLPNDILRALDAWAIGQTEPRPDRQETILRALQDWLIGLGMLSPGSDVSEGLH